MEVILIAALSADGFIARQKHELSTKWTSKEDARWFSRKTKEIGICIMGKTTYDTIGRPLPGRLIYVLSKTGQPMTILPNSEITEAGSVLVTSSSPEEIVTVLRERGVARVAVCGGGSVYNQFLQQQLVDHLFLTIEPALFGAGITLAQQPLDLKLRLLQLHPLSESTIVLEYVNANRTIENEEKGS